MLESGAGVGVLSAVQAVMIKDAITNNVKSVYLIVLTIFSFLAYYYTVKQKRPVLPGVLYHVRNLWAGEACTPKLLMVGTVNVDIGPGGCGGSAHEYADG